MSDMAKIVGSRIKALRERRNLTQAEVHAETGVSQGRISTLESGQAREIQAGTLMALADFFGVSIDYLCGRTEEEEEDVLLAAR